MMSSAERHTLSRRGRWTARMFANRQGMTILEILIATVIGLILTSAAMELYLRVNNQSIAQDQLTEMEQSGRAAVRVLSQRLRMAGFGLPATLAPLAGRNSNPDTVTITHQNAGACQASLSANMAQPSDPLVCNGSNLGCFSPVKWAYVYDAVTNVGEFFEVTEMQLAPPAFVHGKAPLSRAYPLGSTVSWIEQYTYYINRADTAHPVLMEKPLGGTATAYAEGIEDLELSYVMQSGDTVTTLALPNMVRDVIVRLVARTGRVDKEITRDYRRREFVFNVSVRNLAL